MAIIELRRVICRVSAHPKLAPFLKFVKGEYKYGVDGDASGAFDGTALGPLLAETGPTSPLEPDRITSIGDLAAAMSVVGA